MASRISASSKRANSRKLSPKDGVNNSKNNRMNDEKNNNPLFSKYYYFAPKDTEPFPNLREIQRTSKNVSINIKSDAFFNGRVRDNKTNIYSNDIPLPTYYGNDENNQMFIREDQMMHHRHRVRYDMINHSTVNVNTELNNTMSFSGTYSVGLTGEL